jgi:hypothetical protein
MMKIAFCGTKITPIKKRKTAENMLDVTIGDKSFKNSLAFELIMNMEEVKENKVKR